ncbi:AsmA family protein, partial [Salmonella enterica subsp. enterica]|nr:AsmA family protein [Salmonella enterica subsp. enterica]
VGQGSILANLQLDGRKDVVHTVADIDFRKLDFSRIVEKMSVFKGAGTVGGNARLDARGNSVAAMRGDGDGELRLFMTGGDISALLVNLAGLDFGNVLVSA